MAAKISAILIVLNEEENLPDCLRALDWVDEIVVVDSCSKDRSVEVAKQSGARVFTRAFDDFSGQKNYAVEQASGPWILSIDADERVTPELRQAVEAAIRQPAEWDGFYVTRKNYVFGKNLRFGGRGTEQILRVFRKDKGRFVQPIHEKVKVEGPVGKLAGYLMHQSLPNWEEYRRKFGLYTQFEAQWLLEQGARVSFTKLYWIPMARFIYYYFFRFGFLDGFAGLRFHALSSFYYHMKYQKLRAIQVRQKSGTGAADARPQKVHA